MEVSKDLLIRDISLTTHLSLEKKAKKSGLSKNKYLVNLVETHAIAEEVEGVKDDYKDIIQHALFVIKKNTEVMEELIRLIEG